MGNEPSGRVTELLARIGQGQRAATDELLPLVYTELRQLARVRMSGERPGQTLQATALVHEAYLRLVGGAELAWDSRGHFFAAAAEAMRRILIERARRVGRLKHGGDLQRVTLDAVEPGYMPDHAELLAIDEALSRLEDLDETMARVVKLRYFGGLSIEETARAMGISTRSVNRAWTGARAWLRRELSR
jgi:RNA polymerase sigma factor (TIGR02999 family)